jgi:hypothetical protein
MDEIVDSSGNVFADLNLDQPELRRLLANSAIREIEALRARVASLKEEIAALDACIWREQLNGIAPAPISRRAQAELNLRRRQPMANSEDNRDQGIQAIYIDGDDLPAGDGIHVALFFDEELGGYFYATGSTDAEVKRNLCHMRRWRSVLERLKSDGFMLPPKEEQPNG